MVETGTHKAKKKVRSDKYARQKNPHKKEGSSLKSMKIGSVQPGRETTRSDKHEEGKKRSRRCDTEKGVCGSC